MSGAAGPVVVVGAGAAGLSVAAGLRRLGYRGPVTVVGEERHPPYDRPPLSKQVLAGAWPAERAYLMAGGRLEKLDVAWELAERAVGIDRKDRAVALSSGREIPYAQLVIATGVAPRTLPAPDLEGVHVLRTMDDAAALRERLAPGARLVVVGAGFLGLEVAATARRRGVAVTVVEPLQAPLADRLGELTARRLLRLHAENGVELATGLGVEAILGEHEPPPFPLEGAGGEPGGPEPVRRVRLSDGAIRDADAVLVAIGCQPQLDWLRGSGLELDDGIVCDGRCSAGEGVWAAGDVARWYHPRLQRHIRIEHRMNANEQGQAVAANIVGRGEDFAPVPFFWTDHYDVKVQVWGVIPAGAAAELVEGSEDGDSFVVAFRERPGGRMVGALGWNAMRAMPRYRSEIAASW